MKVLSVAFPFTEIDLWKTQLNPTVQVSLRKYLYSSIFVHLYDARSFEDNEAVM